MQVKTEMLQSKSQWKALITAAESMLRKAAKHKSNERAIQTKGRV